MRKEVNAPFFVCKLLQANKAQGLKIGWKSFHIDLQIFFINCFVATLFEMKNSASYTCLTSPIFITIDLF